MKKKNQESARQKVTTPSIQYVLAAIVGGALVGLVFFLSSAANRAQTFCANSISCIHHLSAEVENDSLGFSNGQPIRPPKISLVSPTSEDADTSVLGTTDATGEKHIYVDLAKQTLYAFQGNTLILNTLVSTGKWHPTPPGEYHIWIKLRSTRMTGGSGNDAYDLPNVPFVMFFANDTVPKEAGFSLHGAYWHDNFGHEMSHGCVNMRSIDAETMYNWTDPPTVGATTYATAQNPGTAVSICQQVQIQNGIPLCVE